MVNRYDLLNVICRIQADRQTGSLHLAKGEKRITVYFQEGLIDAAASNIAPLQLGRFIAKIAHVDASTLDRLLKEARKKRLPLGKAVRNRKLITETELEDGIREQIIETLAHALDNEFDVSTITNSTESLHMPARLELSRVLLELARHNVEPFRLEPRQRIILKSGAGFTGLPWYPQELSVLNQLNQPRTLQELAAATGLDYQGLCKVLGVFNSLHLLSGSESADGGETALLVRNSFPFESLTPEIGRHGLSDKIETLLNESSFVSEQFKSLKVRLSEASSLKPLRVITISSSLPGDGKSLISVNLAASFSKDPNRRVIIIDCDLRRPSLHKLLGTSPQPGLLGYLGGELLQPYCYVQRCERLYFMTAGGIADNPIELLSHERMKKLLDYLRTEFDTVILDSPPLVPISDAQILTALSDGLILVVRCGRTSYAGIEKAFRNLDRNKLVGVILNDVKPMLFNTQYDYKYYNYKNREYYPYGKHVIASRPKTYLEK
jgi:capsular exopolysaccharide synthesis family protein